MTLEYLAADIVVLPRRQDNQKTHWQSWGMAANVAGAILFAAVMLKVAMTGEDPPIAMIVIALMVSFVGIAFTTVGRLLALSR
jgi:Na+/melibiose symporter-like transporter